jgi:hypothetical protein
MIKHSYITPLDVKARTAAAQMMPELVFRLMVGRQQSFSAPLV